MNPRWAMTIPVPRNTTYRRSTATRTYPAWYSHLKRLIAASTQLQLRDSGPQTASKPPTMPLGCLGKSQISPTKLR